jgi:ribosomal protein S18 acetylase RimI-like enzyme
MQPLTFRQATEADMPFLLQLRRQTMSAHQIASGVSPSEAEHLKRVRVAFQCAQVIESGARPVGLLKVVRGEAAWELLQIQLAPEFQGRGIGTMIVTSAVEEARNAGVALRLSVLKANPAKRLYQRIGFVVVREKAHAYEMALAA